MSFSEAVQGVTSCAGVVGTAIADRDGIPVQLWGDEEQIEEVVAQLSTFLGEVRSANRELHMGTLEQLHVVGSQRQVMVTMIAEDYFLITIVDNDGNPGKARFASRVAAHRLRSEFV
jgi:predicted regulator of Ras-like GTPase activity (Roadblock/LC7/MglB family)